MADQKASELTLVSPPPSTALIYGVIDPAGTPGSRVFPVNDFATAAEVGTLAADSTDATLVGATDAANPAGRGAYAAALVTSMQTRRLRGVTLRDLLGKNYNPANGAAATINSFTAELAPAGIAITDPHGTEVRAETQIILRDDLKMHFSPGTVFKKAFNSNSDIGGMFSSSAANWNTPVNRVHISGGVFQSLQESVTGSGRLVTIYGHDCTIEGTYFKEWWGGQGMVFAGDRFLLQNTRHYSTIASDGQAPFRMLGGSGFRGIGIWSQGGDDQLQFVPSTGPTSPSYDQDITDSYFIGCWARSLSARAFVAVIAGQQDLNQNTCVIRRVGWIGCTGYGVTRSAIIENSEGDGATPRAIDDILISGCTIDGQYEDTINTQSMMIQAPATVGIGRVTIRDTQFVNTPRDYAIRVDSNIQELVLDNVRAEGVVGVINVAGGTSVNIMARNLRLQAGTTHPVIFDAGAGSPTLHLDGYNHIVGVASTRDGIRVNNSTATIIQRGVLRVDKASAATTVDAIFAGAGSTVNRDVITGDFDGSAVTGGATAVAVQTS